jgi:formylglycine-generating enzyme required for sulfatase activity
MRPAEQERRDFFVSFNSADREHAEWIAGELKAAGKTVFFAPWDCPPGCNLVLWMDRAARRADRTIVVLSENYLKALYTQPEWAAYFAGDPTGAGRRVIPVRVQECEAAGLLKAIVYIDLVGCEEAEARRRLLEGVREGLAKPEFVAFPGKAGVLPTREREQSYLARLLGETEELARLYSPLYGIAEIRRRGEADPLLSLWKDDPGIALLRHSARRSKTAEKREVRDYDDILTAFAEVKRAVLLGEPGSGKTTTLRKLAAELAQRARQDPQAPLPLLAGLGNWRGDESLAEFLAQTVPEIGWATEALGQAGRLVLLLDGLNEVPTARRADKAAEVRRLPDALDASTAIIVSCRREDYTGDLDLELDTLTLEPLSPKRIRDAVRRWVAIGGKPPELADRFFWQLAGDERLAGVLQKWVSAGAGEDIFWSASDPQEHKEVYARTSLKEDELWRRHIRNPRSLVRLASNPFMLTMLFQVWVLEKGALPQNRGELFGRFINGLLRREGLLVSDGATGEWRLKPEGGRLLEGLVDLAWRMQRERIGTEGEKSGDFGVLTVISRAAALEALGEEALLKKAVDSTLLEGGGELRFRHQLLQEYFTAQALRGRMKQAPAAELWPPDRWWERSGWEETAVLLAGLHADDCTPVIRWLKGAQPEVAAQCILESGAELAGKEAVLGELQTAWLPLLTDVKMEPRPEARAAIGRALGRLELDNRKGVGVKDGVPDMDWVEIPGGEFLYQENERRRIKTFYMARYPVTNAQYEAFLNAEDGYSDDRWWEGLSAPDRSRPRPSWTESNSPRETVSWHEAMAFCAWLSHKAGFEIRLPTEWEWERAARGTDGRVYPWGEKYVDGYANTYEDPHRVGRTSAVGIYPEGASPEGVLDLSGNVWEWCLNEYHKPKRTQRGGIASRVLRGGAWANYQDFARADGRLHIGPDGRFNIIGFRVVCSSPIR